jgi:hypothetical protein
MRNPRHKTIIKWTVCASGVPFIVLLVLLVLFGKDNCIFTIALCYGLLTGLLILFFLWLSDSRYMESNEQLKISIAELYNDEDGLKLEKHNKLLQKYLKEKQRRIDKGIWKD